MKYEYKFRDNTDIEECREYLKNNYKLAPLSYTMTADRYFEVVMQSETTFNTLFLKFAGDNRIEDISKTVHYSPVTTEVDVITIRAKILPSETTENR